MSTHDIEWLQAKLSEDVLCVAVMAVNNEIGTIQPLAQIGQLCAQVGASPQAAEAANDVARRQMGEKRVRQDDVGTLREAVELKPIRDDEFRAALGREFRAELLRHPAVDQDGVPVEAEVVAWIQVSDERNAPAKRAAGDVEKDVMRFQPLRDEEIELHQGVVVYVPRGVKHKAKGNLTVLLVCVPPGVMGDIHEVE